MHAHVERPHSQIQHKALEPCQKGKQPHAKGRYPNPGGLLVRLHDTTPALAGAAHTPGCSHSNAALALDCHQMLDSSARMRGGCCAACAPALQRQQLRQQQQPNPPCMPCMARRLSGSRGCRGGCCGGRGCASASAATSAGCGGGRGRGRRNGHAGWSARSPGCRGARSARSRGCGAAAACGCGGGRGTCSGRALGLVLSSLQPHESMLMRPANSAESGAAWRVLLALKHSV